MKEEVKPNPTYIEVKTSDHFRKWEDSRAERYREYRKKWSENPKKQIVGDFPIHLDIESTRKCNLRCPMCPRTVKLERGEIIEEGDMDFELYKKVVDEGAENGLYSIKLVYLGEPLICKDIVKMVAYAKEKGIIDVMLNTNGVLLTEDMSKALIGAGIDKIFISFDSPKKERYEKLRKGANFESVIKNVKNLVRIREELKSINPLVRVSMVVMKENKGEVLDYLKLWVPIVDAVGFGDYVNPQQKDTKGGERSIIDHSQHKGFICAQLYQRLFVHWDGKIGLCCADFDAEMGLGNARDVKIKDVWLGEKMQRIRALHEKGEWYKVPLCTKCDIPYA